MARMTLGQARDKAADLQRTVARLRDLHNGEVEGSKSDQPRRSWQVWKQNRNGRLYELERLEKIAADLVTGLAGVGPARNGQIGGQRQGGHDTSATALALVAPKAGTQRNLVLNVLAEYPVHGVGCTDVELVRMSGLSANSVRPRRVELVDAGWLEDSGIRRDHNGRPHVVWRLTEAARERLQSGGIDT